MNQSPFCQLVKHEESLFIKKSSIQRAFGQVWDHHPFKAGDPGLYSFMFIITLYICYEMIPVEYFR
jgi:hypothetical protein